MARTHIIVHSIQSAQLGLRTDSSVKYDALFRFTAFRIQTCLIMCIYVHALRYSTLRKVHIAFPSRFLVLARKFHPARLFQINNFVANGVRAEVRVCVRVRVMVSVRVRVSKVLGSG